MLPPVSHSDQAEAHIVRLIREDWGRILASLTSKFGNYALAEDCLQDAVVAALETWPIDGLPDSPPAWMHSVAQRRALDRLRRQHTMTSKEEELARWLELQRNDPPAELGAIPDQRLELIYTCCHPALEEKSRVALTLRALGGLSTEEIAKAFLDKPEAMAARLTRAKKKLNAAGIGFKLPEPADIAPRAEGVLQVIYLIYNEGAHASNGALFRGPLAEEAIRLARILMGLLPDHAEVKGLLALMLLSDSRRFARVGPEGEFIPLENQNRARWDQAKIKEGLPLVEAALSQAPVGSYAIQAAISALHAQAASFSETDWRQIALLYDLLQARAPNPVHVVNQAVALSYAHGPEVGLRCLEGLENEPKLQSYQPYHACRADLLARAGEAAGARLAYERAIALSTSAPQIAFLKARLSALG